MSPSDPPKRKLKTTTGEASYTDEGEGPVVVAVHGLPGSARDFRWLAPLLSPQLRFIRVELPGFGDTPVATEPDASPTGRARFVVSFVKAMGLEGALLLGHSMGGVDACAAFELEPTLFSKLALISSPGLWPHALLRRTPTRTLHQLLSKPLLRRALTPLLRWSFVRGGFRGYPDSALYRAIECLAATSIALHAERVRRLQIPTLVAWCEDDPLIEPEIAQALADACPEGPRLRFPQGGHNPQKSHAEEIAAALLTFVATTGPGDGLD